MEQAIFTFIMLLCGLLLVCHLAGNIFFTCGMIRVKSVNTIILQSLLSFAVVFVIHILVGHDVMHGTSDPATQTATWVNALFNLIPTQQRLHPEMVNVFKFYQALLPCISVAIIASITAERLRTTPFLFFTIILTAVIFPVAAYWVWGRSWLTQFGFVDNSGSSLVYLIGSLAGLTGSLILGPRIKRYSPNPLEASNIPLAFQGMLFIILGCFGFNVGTYLMQSQQFDFDKISLILINTTLALSAGMIIMSVLSKIFFRVADLTLIMNGAIAGMVAIAPMPLYDTSTPALIIGSAASLAAFVTIHLFNSMEIEDPAGSFASFGVATVIGVCSIPTTKSFFEQVCIQLVGLTAISAWVVTVSAITWIAIRLFTGLGYHNNNTDLDINECGISAYPQFQIKVSS